MPSKGSVTNWLHELRAGDDLGAQRLWERYFARLVGLGRARLVGKPRTLNDPEDVALSAFKSFFAAARQRRFPKLNDRHDLWQILVMLTARKAIDALRRAGNHPVEPLDPENLIGPEPTPAFAVEVADACRELLARLPDDSLRDIALLKLEGYTNDEIAARLERSRATVERKLAYIRRTWEEGVA